MEHILSYSAKHRMFPPNRPILCAFSGGGDSTALLHFLKFYGFTVAAAHFDHHLRLSSEWDAACARRFCEKHNIPFYLGEANVAAMEGNVEENARNARYAFLEATADQIGAAVIATAHTADDNLETVLMHMTRGCGLNGLTGIQPCRGRVVRPMLHTTRQAVEEYLEENDLDYVTDPTNADDRFVRNRIRHQVVPILKDINPKLLRHIMSMTEYLREDERILNDLARDERLASRNPALAYRRTPPPPPSLLPSTPPLPPCLTPQTLLSGRTLVVSDGAWAVKMDWVDSTPDFQPKWHDFYLSAEKTDVFAVRGRKTGDRLHPPNRTGKTVKKWLIEMKIPEKQRDFVPILTKNQDAVVAAAVIGPDQAALAKAGQPSVHIIWYKLQ